MIRTIISLIFVPLMVFADTPPPNTVKAKMYSGDGAQQITATAGALNVNVTGGGGGGTVDQGLGGISPWLVSVANSSLPVTGPFLTDAQLRATPVPISGSVNRTWVLSSGSDSVSSVQSGAWSTGRTWTLNSGTDSVTISGSVTATNSANGPTGSPPPADATQIGGTDGVNLVALKSSSTGVLSVDASGSSVSVSNFPATQAVTQSGTWTVQQGTPPWSTNLTQISGLSPSVTNSIPARITNGTSFVDPTQIRSLSSIGDSVTAVISGTPTVVANAGSGTFQTNVTNVSLPVTQSGTWTTGRTWNLNSGTDSVTAAVTFPTTVAVTQSTSPWVVSGTVTANAGTNLNTSALALESGGHLASIDSKTPALGQALAAASVPVVLTAAQLSTLTPLSTVAVTQSTSPWVTSATQSGNWSVRTQDGSGNLLTSQVSGAQRALDVGINVAGVQVDPRTRTWTLSSGTDSVSAAISNFPATTAVTQSTSPWVVSGTVTANAGTNLNTSALALESGGHLASIDSKTPALGQALAAASVPVVLTAAQLTTLTPLSTVAVTQSTSPWVVSGTVTANAGTGNFTVVQATGTNLHTVVDSAPTTAVTQSGTWNINNISGTISLPTGAATSANQTNGSEKTQIVDGAGAVVGPVQTISSTNYMPVVLAASGTTGSAVPARTVQIGGSDGTNLRTFSTDTSGNLNVNTASSTGRTTVNLARNDYTSTNVTTAAYVQLIASTADTINQLYIFDSSGQTLFLAVGAAASEVNKAYIVPGGNGILNLTIPSGSRVSVKAVSATANAGELNITFLK